MSIDSHMLLAKLCYACGYYDEAMQHCTEAKLNSVIQTDLQIRNIRILAESFAVKGMNAIQENYGGNFIIVPSVKI